MFADFCQSLPFEYVWMQDLDGSFTYRSASLRQPQLEAETNHGSYADVFASRTAKNLENMHEKVVASQQAHTFQQQVHFREGSLDRASCYWNVTLFPIHSRNEERKLVGVGGFVRHSSPLSEDSEEPVKQFSNQGQATCSDVGNLTDSEETQTSSASSRTSEGLVEDHLRDMLNASATRSVLLAADGSILECNRAFALLFPLSQHELTGKVLSELAPLADHPTTLCSEEQKVAVQRLVDMGQETHYETQVNDTWWDCAVLPARFCDKGNVQTLIVEEKNITSRKRTELDLQEQQTHHMGLFHHMPTGYAFCQAIKDEMGTVVDYIFLEVNEHFEDLVGVPAEKCVGKRVTEAMPGIEKEDQGLMGTVDRVVKESYTDNFSYYSVTLGRWYSGITYKHSDDKFITLFLDNTESMMMQEKLRESEEKHRALFESMQQGVSYLGSDFTLIDCNPSAERLLGLTKDQILGKSSVDPDWKSIREDGSDFPDDEVPMNIALRTGKSVNNVIMGVYHPVEKSHRWLLVDARPRFRPGEDKPYQCYAIFTDITESRRAKQQLLAAKEKAEVADQLKSAFLATMSHEIRTPVNGIIGHLDLVLSNNLDDSLRAENLEGLRIAMQSGGLLISIIEDILDLSKIEAGQLDIQSRPFSLRGTIEHTMHLARAYQHQKKQQHVVLQAKVEESIFDQIIGDDYRLRQILNNLLSNAVKFTASGSIILSVDVCSDNKEIQFSVRDTGKGIPNDHLEVIFQPFRQVEFGDTRTHGGTGLGLTIAKKLVQLLGGRLTVTSTTATTNHGSSFVFTLPYKKATTVEETRMRHRGISLDNESENVPRTRPTGKILLAEDDLISRRIAQRMLQKIGYSVVLAEDGVQAVSIFKEQMSDIILVLCDVMMPNMDGCEATQKIREFEKEMNRPFSVPVVALSAGAMKGDRERGLDYGMTDYMTKPVTLRELAKTLQRHIGLEDKYDLALK